MYTGENDPYKLSSISSFNGKNSLSIWNSEEGEICNKGKNNKILTTFSKKKKNSNNNNNTSVYFGSF